MAEVCYKLGRLLLVQEMIKYEILQNIFLLADWHVRICTIQYPYLDGVRLLCMVTVL